MLLADFPVVINYTQVLVRSGEEAPAGLLWTDAHVDQGFAWSEGLVSFGVPDHDGNARMEVELVAPDAPLPDPGALWAVQVPFEVAGPVEIGSILELRNIAVPAGRYDLVFQAFEGAGDDAYVLRVTFAPNADPGFRILRPGGDVVTTTVLREDAEALR